MSYPETQGDIERYFDISAHWSSPHSPCASGRALQSAPVALFFCATQPTAVRGTDVLAYEAALLVINCDP